MYLARQRKGNVMHYAIRESYLDDRQWKSRHLYDLGTDPSRYIHYPGGNGYYYAPEILDSLSDKGLDIDQSSLDIIFFEFLSPQIRRVIDGFDRSRRNPHPQAAPPVASRATFHLFDKRRFYFLRFGPRHRQNIHRVPAKIFRSLQCKSRDELSWEELKRLPRQSLSRRYRRLSLKHHPDHGGDPAQFDRLTQIYRHLLKQN